MFGRIKELNENKVAIAEVQTTSKEVEATKNPSKKEETKRSLILMTVVNHIIWSGLPIISRYLQVFAPVTIDGLVLISSSKFVALVCVFLFGNINFVPIIDTKDGGIENSDDVEKQKSIQKVKETSLTKKVSLGLLYGALTAVRSSMTVLSPGFTTATNAALISNLSPVAVPLAEAIFLKSKLPKVIWPTVFVSTIGCSLVILAQSQNHDLSPDTTSSHHYHTFSNKDLIGCSMQFMAIFLTAAARLMMKITSNVLTRNEILQFSNFGCVIFPLCCSLYMDPSSWLYFSCFFELPLYTIAGWVGLSVFIYFVGSTMQMELVRALGPGLYTSMTGIRVLSVVFLSSVWLGEPVQNGMELWGILLTVATIGIYVKVLLSKGEKKDECEEVEYVEESELDNSTKGESISLLTEKQSDSYRSLA